MDTIELSYAEAYENIIKSNLFACSKDDVIVKKAEEQGVLPTLNVKDNKVRVTLSEDWQERDGEQLLHIYAFIRFSATADEPSGYAYIKVYDAKRNQHLIDDFVDAVEKAGGTFEHSYLVERFKKAKMN
jgi:hypothetical protein